MWESRDRMTWLFVIFGATVLLAGSAVHTGRQHS
jgi:hypothetical protein